MRTYLIAPLLIGLWIGSAVAADKPRYGSWQAPQDQTQALTEELRRLVDEAARARAADPRFLEDLRALADRYGKPVVEILISDDFSDGDFTANPEWNIASGRFEMDWQGGLHSNVTAPQAAAQPAQKEPAKRERGEDIALRLLGQILNPDQGRRAQSSQQAAAPAAPPVIPAEAYLVEPVSNAFTLTATLAMEASAGPVSFAVYQGKQRSIGYFLVYDPTDGLMLQRRGARGSVTIATGAAQLADGANHVVNWNRTENGDMTVSVDDLETLRVTDSNFRDDWDGISVINGGGAMTLRAVTVSGTR